jgi:peptidoglycan/LPS O-acetylase OafA/YrhL
MGTTGRSTTRVAGLDTIRFVSSFVVVLFHFGLIPPSIFGPDPHGLAVLGRGVLGSLFNGPAAVIVFFVISGFCIHYPYRRTPSVNVPAYYSRRLIRIGGPALVALWLWALVGVRVQAEDTGIFWSVVCEVEYYLLYPLLLRLRLRVGWVSLIAIAQLAAIALAFSHLSDIQRVAGGYPAFGCWNWVIGLPCWLMGCWLAEAFERFREPSSALLWLSRIGIFGTSAVLQALRFHGGSVFLSNAFTLNLFAIVACLWLGLEIAYRRRKPAPRVLEWAGKWSYSLYLMHPAVPGILLMLAFLSPIYSSIAVNLFMCFCSLVLACGFYLVVEAPFHRLAVTVSRRLGKRRPAGSAVIADNAMIADNGGIRE